MPISDILGIHWAFMESRILQVAVDVGVFEALPAKGATAAEAAKARGLDAAATEALLNALTGMGLLRKRGDRFYLTQDARRFLVADSPRFFGHMVRFDSRNWALWERIHETLRTGKTARAADMFQNDEATLRDFIYGMHSIAMARGDADIIPERADLSRHDRILDVGGGPGTYAIGYLRRHRRMEATVFDLPATLRFTKDIVTASGVGDRVRLSPGDYTKDRLPAGHDAILLFNIIHSEEADMVKRLLAKCADALAPGGTLVIKDHIMDRSLTSPRNGAVFGVAMALFTGGRCYAFDELRTWLHEAGFANVREIKPRPPLTQGIVVARKADGGQRKEDRGKRKEDGGPGMPR